MLFKFRKAFHFYEHEENLKKTITSVGSMQIISKSRIGAETQRKAVSSFKKIGLTIGYLINDFICLH